MWMGPCDIWGEVLKRKRWRTPIAVKRDRLSSPTPFYLNLSIYFHEQIWYAFPVPRFPLTWSHIWFLVIIFIISLWHCKRKMLVLLLMVLLCVYVSDCTCVVWFRVCLGALFIFCGVLWLRAVRPFCVLSCFVDLLLCSGSWLVLW